MKIESMIDKWWTDPADIRMRLDELDKCLGRGTLNEADTTELVSVRYLLHRALIRVQLRNFDKA